MNKTKFIGLIAILFIAIRLLSSCNEDEPKPIKTTPFSEVKAFIINDEGEKILATDMGVFMLNVKNETYELLNTGSQISTYNDLANFNNDLWIASNTGVLNNTTQKVITSANSGLHNSVVRHINFDTQNRSYFATPNGISILNGDEWIKNLGRDSLYLKYEISDIATASNGFTYSTTNGGGIERFKVDVDGISGATVFDTDWTKLKSNNVFTVFIDDTVQAYGTDLGVAMHYSEYTKWNWENYTTADGLINDTVLSIIKDNTDNWWFGTAHGLSMLNNSQWTNYTVETDGIIDNTIKFLAIDADGSLWMASDKGLSHYFNNSWYNY